jgi:Uma2 family endonuclease
VIGMKGSKFKDMRTLIDSPPRTMMEVFKTLPEGTLAELIDNQLYMSPSPAFNHQDILIDIASQLRTKLHGAGRISIALFDVYLDESSNAVQPDIVIILNSNKGILNRKGHFHGVPDVVVEILSPSNRDYDLIKKKALYERFRIPEYWIIDPDSKSAMVFVLEQNQYRLAADEAGQIKSPLLQASFSF